MEQKYFKKIYQTRTAFGQWKTGDGINYNNPEDEKYTVEFITKAQYTNGVKNMPEIPKTRKQLIEDEKNDVAIESLKTKGIFNSKGELA